MLLRTSRSVGSPTAAVIRRTWRLRPSRRESSIQLVGMEARQRTGGVRARLLVGIVREATAERRRARLERSIQIGRMERRVAQREAGELSGGTVVVRGAPYHAGERTLLAVPRFH